jgi:hypothetical protein
MNQDQMLAPLVSSVSPFAVGAITGAVFRSKHE